MGGLLIIFAVVLSTLLWADLTNHYIWLAVLATVGFGLVGFADDYIKFVGKRSKGLTASQKFLAQGMVALAIGMFFYFLPGYSTQLSVPFFKSFTPDLGWLYIPFAVLVIVGASNAVNLTDGLDGLAVGPIMIASLAYTIVVYVVGNRITAEYLLDSPYRWSRRVGGLYGGHIRRQPRVSVVQHVSGLCLHGGCRLAAVRRGAWDGGGDQ